MNDMQNPIDLIERQRALEEESLALGIVRYNREREGKSEIEMAPGRRLLLDAIGPTSKAIAEFISAANAGGAGRRHTLARWLTGFDPDALAFHVASATINGVASGDMWLQNLASNVASAIENDVNYERFREAHPGLYAHLQQVLKKSTSSKHSKGVMANALRKAEVERFQFPTADRVLVGVKLVELFIEATGMAQLHNDRSRGVRSERVIVRGTEALLEWLDKAHQSAACFYPVRMPMLVPPRPWEGVRGGGYLTDAGGALPLVRTRNRAYLRELENADMPLVYSAINAIQATPWKINTAVLDVMREAWEAGGGIGGLPRRDLLDLPPRPAAMERDAEAYKAGHPDEFKAWKRSRAQVYEENARSVSKRVAAAQKIALAERFRDEAAIYFPHTLDFRGRAYPVPSFLTPQGDDAAKALLHFARPYPLGDEGPFWLAVHLANCWGVDKVSFEERVAWVHANEDAILDSAFDPLDGGRFWTEADSPWCALAAAFEWAGYRIQGKEYLSRIPVALDGSCNGLQNFSAMLRDPVGGAATNLVPQEKPADIYTQVMNVAAEQVRVDAAAGDPCAIFWDGQLSRKIVKTPVMTLPYGVTRSGMRSQVLDAMKHEGLEDRWDAAEYLAGVLWDCIGRVVIAARSAMDWLRAAARVAASGNAPVSWTTPVGFPVLQEYREAFGKRIKVHVGGRALQLGCRIEGTKLDRRRQAMGISPNFVHSCDASHMMMTTVLAVENGVDSFAMIHDSYGTHAAKAGILAAALRHAFVEQYGGDVLGEFKRELEEQLPAELAADLPPLPDSGDLDLSLVLDSRYFFA